MPGRDVAIAGTSNGVAAVSGNLAIAKLIINRSTASNRYGQVYLANTYWPPVTRTNGGSGVEAGINRDLQSVYRIRRGFCQFNIPTGTPTTNVILKIYVGVMFSGITPDGFTLTAHEIPDFYPKDASDYDLDGPVVASTYVAKGESSVVRDLVMSGYTIVPGTWYSLQFRTSLEGTKPSNQAATEAELVSTIALQCS
jgi:hypothetical protein